MNTKIVYSFDPNTRSFMGAITLDASDLSPLDREEGRDVWIVPGNCTEVAPPADVPVGKYAAVTADGISWEVVDVPVPVGVRAAEASAGSAARVLAPPEHASMLHATVQQHLDATARTQRFNDMAEAVSYIGSAVLKYQLQAAALRDMRDSTWAMVEPIVDDIAAGAIEPMKFAALVPTLPVYNASAVAQAIEEASPDYEPAPAPAPQVVPQLPAITQEAVDTANAQIATSAAEAAATTAAVQSRKSKKKA